MFECRSVRECKVVFHHFGCFEVISMPSIICWYVNFLFLFGFYENSANNGS